MSDRIVASLPKGMHVCGCEGVLLAFFFRCVASGLYVSVAVSHLCCLIIVFTIYVDSVINK